MASAVRAEADHRVVGNLPLELTSFVGRRRELADARRLFESSRLLTLTGVGGVGKTRLAIRLAVRAGIEFDGSARSRHCVGREVDPHS
ncbi:hypothetical protein ACKAMS_06760 [Rhodococcus sp. 5A-K4]|uniref:hypothetical protein n=1 Tax=Rhodococcus sp. 5A-K4 TaxID=3384442 RepID=UPI0038D3D85E